jgi:hypothetical protein
MSTGEIDPSVLMNTLPSTSPTIRIMNEGNSFVLNPKIGNIQKRLERIEKALGLDPLIEEDNALS